MSSSRDPGYLPSGEGERPCLRCRCFFWTFVLLVVAGIAGVVWRAWISAPYDLQRLQRVAALLEWHPDLMWRVRPDLDTTFEGTDVWTDRQGMRITRPADAMAPDPSRGMPEIAAFGGSPTFGYGVQADQAWPAVLQSLLRERLPAARVRNAGQIGYTSWQGRRLVAEVIDDWKPDLVLIDFVVNDVERLRFFFPDGREDGEASLPSAARVRVGNALRFFPPTAALLEATVRLGYWAKGKPDPRWIYELASVRTPIARYGENLRAMVSMCRQRRIPVAFVVRAFQLPFEIPDPPEGLGLRIDEAQAALDAGDAAGARDKALQARDLDRGIGSRPHYLLGRALEALGDEEAARESYSRAVAAIIVDCIRDARLFNESARKLAGEMDVPIADLTPWMGDGKADMRYYLPGDYIHPNPAGQRLTARSVANVVLRLLGDGDGGLFEEGEDPVVGT